MNLLDEHETLAEVRSRLKSREWWLFISSSPIAQDVENTYYAGEANADFHAIIGPMAGYVVGLLFAHKRRMTRSQLAHIMRSYTDVGFQTPKQDIICVVRDQQDQDRVLALQSWIVGDGEWLRT